MALKLSRVYCLQSGPSSNNDDPSSAWSIDSMHVLDLTRFWRVIDLPCLLGLDNSMVALGRGSTRMEVIYLSCGITRGRSSLFWWFQVLKTSHGWMNHGLSEPAKPLQALAKARSWYHLAVNSFVTNAALNWFSGFLNAPGDFVGMLIKAVILLNMLSAFALFVRFICFQWFSLRDVWRKWFFPRLNKICP